MGFPHGINAFLCASTLNMMYEYAFSAVCVTEKRKLHPSVYIFAASQPITFIFSHLRNKVGRVLSLCEVYICVYAFITLFLKNVGPVFLLMFHPEKVEPFSIFPVGIHKTFMADW